MEYILKSYIKKLTNLSGNNKSLLFLKPTENDLDLAEVDFFFLRPSFSIIDDLLKHKTVIPVSPILDSRNSKINDVSRKIRKIQRKERAVFEEKGARDLYVGWPFVEGKFSDGTLVRCPLIFFPVKLESINDTWIIKLREASEIFFNKSFLTAYSHFNQVRVDDDILDVLFEESFSDSRSFRTALYEILKQNAIEVNFNQDLFKDELQPLTHYTKVAVEEKFKNGELKLYSNAILGLFPPSGSSLIPDYEFLLDQNIADFETFLSRGDEGGLYKKPFIKKEEMMYAPFEMDASQESAIQKVKSGASLVIQGPPGTGKSQLICNVISDFIARGKVVLMVCQKRAALDVVYARLKETGISEFIGLVHDFKNDRDDIFKKILFQIESINNYKEKNNTLRAIQLERNFLQVSRDMDQILLELEEFKRAFFDDKMFGVSIKELYLTCNNVSKPIDLSDEFRNFDINSSKILSQKISYFYKYQDLLRNLIFWNDRVSFRNFTLIDKYKIVNTLAKFNDIHSEKLSVIKKLTGENITINQAIEINSCRDQWKLFIELLKDPLTFQYFKQHFIEKELSISDLTVSIDKLVKIKNNAQGYILRGEMLELNNVIIEARESSQNFFKKVSWQLFSKHKYKLTQILKDNGLSFNFPDLQLLENEISNKMTFEKLLVSLKINWNIPFDFSSPIKEILDWYQLQKKAFQANEIFLKNVHLLKFFSKEKIVELKDNNIIRDGLSSISDLVSSALEWRNFISGKQETFLIDNPEKLPDILFQLENNFDLFVEADSLFHSFSNIEKSILDKLKMAECNSSDVAKVFEQNLKKYWINYLEEVNPILRTVSTLKMDEMEHKLQDLVKEKQHLSKDILQLRVTENTYKNLKYNRLYNPTTYRELKHQVSKKKRRWPVRKVVESFGEEVFQLIPVWLVSPESASAIFPMVSKFDLVVFDEASQCFAEYSIPSIYRAKQIVITGDSQQLKPNDLYSTRYEMEDEVMSDLEVDSLLDLGLKYLPQMSLHEHYRSKSFSLINFSNSHFYNHKLNFLPDRKYLNNEETAIEYIKVEGEWDENCNVIEADVVIKLIQKLLLDNKGKSIGVVCFNYKQSQLIMDKLDDMVAEKNIAVPENLFVKNIENVQGDERDVIIFSLGYAPDRNGKLSMQFGSLNQQGGGNRLNVAITRAREKIFLVSSIYPEQLKVDDSKNEGPKLLRLYLEYAFKISNRIAIPVIKNEKFNSEWYLSYHISGILNEMKIAHNPHFPDVDIAVKEENNYLGCVITDDEMYFQKPVKDFHAYKPMLLRNKNWLFQKIYSRHLYVNKQAVSNSLSNFYTDKDSKSHL